MRQSFQWGFAMAAVTPLVKVPSGISGLDEITGGGLPLHRPTLICGGAGSGKTLFALTFVLEGALKYGEPGVFISFEENEEELAKNVASLGYDLEQLVADNKLAVDYIHVERNEIEETGEYDLEGLFVRVAHAVRTVGAKRIALDTLEALFAGLSDEALLRAELRRLFRWLKDQKLTAVITAERGDSSITRQGLEEYVSDCVILLDHDVSEQIATRRLRVVKYRGAAHGTNEYPFLIDAEGLCVLPITSVELAHQVSTERTTTGIPGLDEMLGGKGFWRGSSVLVSGVAGTGKTTIASSFVDAACRRGERALYFAFEESPPQIVRNMRSVGLDLQKWIDAGQLRLLASRPTVSGLEMHLLRLHREIEAFSPEVVVIDPIYIFGAIGSQHEVKSMLLRLVDYLKSRQTTAIFTTVDGEDAQKLEQSGVSSLMDAWLQLRNLESNGERNRALYVLKSRGMAHSNQIREFMLTNEGVILRKPYLGLSGVVTGSARIALEAMERQKEIERQMAEAAKQRELERKRRQIETQIATLQAELADQENESKMLLASQSAVLDAGAVVDREIAKSRGVE